MMVIGRNSVQRGFSLLEVLVAIVIFAVGLLAIASLQGNLMTSGGEAKARSVASSLAEEQVEQLRSFIYDDDFEAITDTTEAADTVGGVRFQRVTDVTDYGYEQAGGGLTNCAEAACEEVDAKLVRVTVAWCGGDSPSGCDETDLSTDPNTVVVEDVVSRRSSPIGSTKALFELSTTEAPRLPYSPGDAPNTIRIDLEDGTEKESPQPTLETTRGGSTSSEAEKVNTVTRLESITFNTPDTDEVSIQRQEFLAANCTCQTGPDPNLSDAENVGHTPLFWDGDDWIGRIKVSDKPVGHFPNDSNLGSQLNVLCSVCCRDHHDGGTTTTFDHDNDGDTADPTPEVSVAKYNPFRDAGTTGDHDHFDGSLSSPVTSGSYLEACRFARVDSSLQLTTDFRLESLQVLPGTTDEPPTDANGDPIQPFEEWIADYQLYVTNFLKSYATEVATSSTLDYPAQQPQRDEDSTNDDPCDGPLPCADETTYGNRTSPVGGESDPGLPSFDDVPSSTETRQLVGRAIYLDFLHPILQDRIKCRLGVSPDQPENCEDSDVSDAPLLPILPFSEVNVGLQANWAVTRDNLVTVTDEPVASTSDSTYSRGAVTLDDGSTADSDVVASIEQGNVGLTDTHDVTPFDCTDPSRLTIDRLTYEGPGSDSSSITVSGCLDVDPFLIENDVIAPSDVTVTDPFGDSCGTALGDNFYECELKQLATDDGTNTITVTNYSTNQTNVKICLGPLPDDSFAGGTVTDDGKKSETVVFDFGIEDSSLELTMFIEEQSGSSKSCPPGQL